MSTHAWVIGSRGLLGKAVTRAVRSRESWQLFDAEPMNWAEPETLRSQATATATAMLAGLSDGDKWVIAWCAGRVVTSSSASELAAELAQFKSILSGIEEATGKTPAGTGGIFYASSAGGVYAGSAAPPFSELTAPVPISGYGEFKLKAEQAIGLFAKRTGVSALNGRIANLYGPGQSLDKMQGLISHLAHAQLSPTPASVYVSLDTLRDYIYVEDCAALVLDALERTLSERQVVVTKNLISGEGVTIAALIGQLKSISKRNANVMLGSSAAAALQAHDLRLASVVWPELDRRELTPLPVGMYNTLNEMRELLQRGRPA